MSCDFSKLERTPAFVLDLAALKRNLSVIVEIQQRAPVRFLLALKGFAMHAVFPEIAAMVDGASASSLDEALLAADHFAAVHAYAPAYVPRDFSQIAQLASHITFNSLTEYERYRLRIPGIQAGLRINPEYAAVGTELYNPCTPGSRLGVRASQLRSLPQGITGLHAHNLCESPASDSVETLEHIERLFGHLLSSISWLNLGGGHLVTNTGYDTGLLVDRLRQFHARHPHITLYMEPGAAFAWESGTLVASILDIVEHEGITTLMLDTSFATHMPDCLEMPYMPRIRGARIVDNPRNQGEVQPYRLGGASCLAGDWIGSYMFDQVPKVGDKVVFEDMMHYTMVKTTNFNGIGLPDLCICKDRKIEVIKRFSHDEYRSRLS